MRDGRPVALSDGGVGRCETEDARSSSETATDKERSEQGCGCKPCEEEKAEPRPVATHHRLTRDWNAVTSADSPFASSAVLGSFVASGGSVAEEARTRGFAAPALAGCAFIEGWQG